jgi:hypothetical protein
MQGTTTVGASDLLRGAIGALTFKCVNARPSHRPFVHARAGMHAFRPTRARRIARLATEATAILLGCATLTIAHPSRLAFTLAALESALAIDLIGLCPKRGALVDHMLCTWVVR